MNIQMAKKWPEMVVTQSFIKGHSFPITLYLCQMFQGLHFILGATSIPESRVFIDAV